MPRKHSICLLWVLFWTTLIFAQRPVDYPETLRSWEQGLLEIMQKHQIAGMSYALFSKDSIIASSGLGLADVSLAKPATDSTLYLIGSVTKLLTTTAILQLRDAGKLSLQDPIVKYLPELNQMKSRHVPVSAITIEEMLTHHAGIPSDIFKDLFSDDSVPAEHLLKQLAGLYTTYPPDFVFSYSNAAFSLLGIVVERLSGLSYEAYLQQHILQPLEMYHTTTRPTQRLLKLISRTYGDEGEETRELHIRDVAAGGVYSNVLDLAKFGQGYLTGTILPDSSIEQSFSQQNADVPLDLDQAIGYTWNISQHHASGRLYHHSGANLYYRAMFILAPDIGVGVALLTNSRSGSALMRSCFDLLDEIGKAKGTKFTFNYESKGWDIKDKPKKLKLSDDYLRQYTGMYAMPGEFFEMTAKRGKLRTDIDGLNLELLPIDSQRFIPRFRFMNIFPIRVPELRMEIDTISGQVVAVEQNATGDRSLFGHKLEPYAISESWENRLGHYEFQYPDPAAFQFFVSFDLRSENDYLIMDIEVPLEDENLHFVVIPIDEDRAYLAGLGRYGWYIIQALGQEANQPLLEMYGYRWIKID